MTEIRRVGVLGCGLMGSGIAQVAATAGHETIVRDVSQQIWERARGGIEKSLAKFVEKGKLPAADRDAALKRLTFTTATGDLKGCDIVVEAITEDLELKNALWKELDALSPQHTIFASNTSSLTIAAMAAATKRADRFVGLHFFNPVPLMPLVEVVRAVTTSEETFRRAFAFARSLGKEAVAARDNSGFIVNLLLVPYLLDAIRAVEHGVGSVPDIDKAMQLGYDWPRFHAAVNDLPAALLFTTVLFDVAAGLTKRASLQAAALWTLWAGVVGGWVAVLAGLQAEKVIEHGEAIHDLMETHETLALTTMGIFTAVLAWKLFRHARLSGGGELGLRGLSLAGVVGIIWTAVLGGQVLFEHPAGIPNATMQAQMTHGAPRRRRSSPIREHPPGSPTPARPA